MTWLRNMLIFKHLNRKIKPLVFVQTLLKFSSRGHKVHNLTAPARKNSRKVTLKITKTVIDEYIINYTI